MPKSAQLLATMSMRISPMLRNICKSHTKKAVALQVCFAPATLQHNRSSNVYSHGGSLSAVYPVPQRALVCALDSSLHMFLFK
jgi:hypothetical protein